jgi:hypothetical protein
MFTLPSREDLSLLRMRHAFRSSEAISAMLAAAVLWPLTFIVTTWVVVTVKALRPDNLRTVGFFLLLVAVVALAGLAMWSALDWFFSSAGCLVAIVSLILWILFARLFGLAFAKLIALSQIGKGDLSITFALAFSLATGFFFGWHGVRIGLLDRQERPVVAGHGSGDTVAGHFVGLLTGSRQRTQLSLTAIAARVLLIIAKMVQGLSAYLLFFAFGAFLFNILMIYFIAFFAIYDRSRIGSVGGRSAATTLTLGIVAVFGITLTAAFLLTQGAMALKRSARYLSRRSFEQTVNDDPRPPILFLRSFADDQVTLPRPPLHITYWLAEPTPRRLDHTLVERFGNLAPIVAIGKPGEKHLPFGAARLYVTEDKWKPVVEEIATSARGIIIVVDESVGVNWEIERMLQEPFIEKTLFVASPRLGTRGLEAHPLVGPLLSADLHLSKGYSVLAAFRDGTSWRLLNIKKATADDYIVCCQAFLRKRSAAKATDSGSSAASSSGDVN